MADGSALPARISKARRPRWTPSEEARALLETIFSADSFPTFTVRNQLAEQLGIDSRQVQIWFQNRRQRERSKVLSGQMNEEEGEEEGEDPPAEQQLPSALTSPAQHSFAGLCNTCAECVMPAATCPTMTTAFYVSLLTACLPFDRPTHPTQTSPPIPPPMRPLALP